MAVAKQFDSLKPEQKRAVHFLLCEQALKTWQDFVASRSPIHYAESVCGTKQVVDSTLPQDAFRAAQCGQDTAKVAQRYLEPIAALQDGDLQFAKSIEFTYYAIYNLFLKYACREDIDDWLIVNQALASEPDEAQWKSLLQKVIDGVDGEDALN